MQFSAIQSIQTLEAISVRIFSYIFLNMFVDPYEWRILVKCYVITGLKIKIVLYIYLI